MVGRCPLEPSLRRGPRAQPIAQDFRIEKQIADLRWGVGRSSEPLNDSQREIIRQLLKTNSEVKFEKFYKVLDKEGHPKPLGRWLNLSNGLRERLTGDKTSAVFQKLKLTAEWVGLSNADQTRVLNLLANMGSPEIFDEPMWHAKLNGNTALRKHAGPEPVDRLIHHLIHINRVESQSTSHAGNRGSIPLGSAIFQ